MPKIVVNDSTKRISAFGFCEFEEVSGHTVYDIATEQLPDEPRFCKYSTSTGKVTVDQAFKTQALADEAILVQLSALDSDMPRVSEDLIELLVSKGVISESELPQTAQDKLTNRRTLRGQLSGGA